ncbi:MAG: hypothetical protein CMN72_07565 [Sphingomonas sp.]|nr:hypothetical protein [Sphingomonas sp.]
MATLMLTVAGGAIGGPLGAGIGAALGRTIDRSVLFPAERREGPRLTELAVQTSSYGSAIPRLYGTMRVAGTVIWSTDLIEHRSTSGGKGAPKVTRYSYSASFAVLLSARAVQSVGRIWADGKLLRGAAGDFKMHTGFRLHSGGEDQAPDPLIVSAEGAGLTPAHRGCAYAVFEDMALEAFGNRIPSLTFEIVADAGEVDIGAVLADSSGGLVTGEAGTKLTGYCAYGEDVRAVVEQLAEASGCWAAPGAGRIALANGNAPPLTIADSGARAQHDGGGVKSRRIADTLSLPSAVALAYYDPERDYQAGLQRAVSQGSGSERKQALPAAMRAVAAKAMAEQSLAAARAARERRRVTLDWAQLPVGPGACVRIAGDAGIWRVAGWTFEAMVVTLDLRRVTSGALPGGASVGRVLPAPDERIGISYVTAFELPLLNDTSWDSPRIGIAACGAGKGWRQAALMLTSDGGASWQPLGNGAPAAVMGRIITPAPSASALIEDRHNHIEVELFAGWMTLSNADAQQLDGGANLALAGEELLQFAEAAPVGERRWRLSGLRRGLRGTERHRAGMAAGDRFTLIDRDTMLIHAVSVARIGGEIRIRAIGTDDDPAQGPEARVAIDGRSVVPPSPVHFRETREGGAAALSWVRRSRSGWLWIDGAETPLGEAAESYLFDPGDGGRVLALSEPRYAGARSWNANAMVQQAGDWGRSPPVSLKEEDKQ